MLKAIEWRSVFGALLILIGCGLAQLMHGIEHNEYTAAGFLATVLPTYLISLYLKVFGIPVRTTLQLVSLPVGFYVSLLLTLQGNIDSRFFEAGVYAAIGGGFLTLCSYRTEPLLGTEPVSVAKVIPAILLLIFAPIALISSMVPELALYYYWQPSELITALSALFGIVLLQKKEGPRHQRYQFAACYATILVTALAIANALQIYYHTQVTREWEMDIESQIMVGLVTLVALLYGTALYAIVVLISIARSKAHGIMLKNWHLSEAYIFLTFMIIAPQSLYETIANAAN